MESRSAVAYVSLCCHEMHRNRQKCVCESCENGGVGGMIETMMAPGYSSCNPAITECTTLHGASAWADGRRVTMRAMACESSVALNPGQRFNIPTADMCLHCNTAGITTSVVVKKKKKAWPHCFSFASLILSVSLHSAAALEGFHELQILMYFCVAVS